MRDRLGRNEFTALRGASSEQESLPENTPNLQIESSVRTRAKVMQKRSTHRHTQPVLPVNVISHVSPVN